LLFADARDPLDALRWTLAELRRSLGAVEVLRGNPLSRDGLLGVASVDVLAVGADEADPALVRGELLEGVDVGDDGVFASWLTVERRRLSGVSEGVLHAASLSALAGGRSRDAAALASRALELNPFDETLHELLVRCLAANGDVGAARHQATTCELLFERELGRRPDPRVRRAAEDGMSAAGAIGDRATAHAQLGAGVAALDAGAVEPGVACLRSACAEARTAGDPGLLSNALVTLGSALVHAVSDHGRRRRRLDPLAGRRRSRAADDRGRAGNARVDTALRATRLRRGYITDNPLRRLEAGERPRPAARARRALGQDEIARLLAAGAPRHRLLIVTALYTGCASPSCSPFIWGDVDPAPALSTGVRSCHAGEGCRRANPVTDDTVARVAARQADYDRRRSVESQAHACRYIRDPRPAAAPAGCREASRAGRSRPSARAGA
jgi:DNA-binding SARP family transcriptional activator